MKDITAEVQEAVARSGIKNGICSVYSPHTTCCVRVNEFETGFLEDFAQLLKQLVPSDNYYAHDDWDRRTENICPEDMDFGNGHSHCMAMLLGTAGESIPVRDGELCLGTWQRVLFLELDRERDRRWLVQVVGVWHFPRSIRNLRKQIPDAEPIKGQLRSTDLRLSFVR